MDMEETQQHCIGLPLPVGDMIPPCGTFAAHFPHTLGESITYRKLFNTPAEVRTGTPDRITAALDELAKIRQRFGSLAHGNGTLIIDHVHRIEAILRGER